MWQIALSVTGGEWEVDTLQVAWPIQLPKEKAWLLLCVWKRDPVPKGTGWINNCTQLRHTQFTLNVNSSCYEANGTKMISLYSGTDTKRESGLGFFFHFSCPLSPSKCWTTLFARIVWHKTSKYELFLCNDKSSDVKNIPPSTFRGLVIILLVCQSPQLY